MIGLDKTVVHLCFVCSDARKQNLLQLLSNSFPQGCCITVLSIKISISLCYSYVKRHFCQYRVNRVGSIKFIFNNSIEKSHY